MHTKPRSHRRCFVERTIACFAVVLLVALAAGCASVNRLREAQDAFNQAAASENALRFDSTQPLGSASDAPASWSVARNGYASALLSLEKIDTEDQKRLRADGLWGTALTLKALSQWRLGLFSKAIATAEEAERSAGDQIYPRDRAVLAALPGLIKTDQAYAKILATNTALANIAALLIGENGAVANVQTGREIADKNHPVQVYLIQAQLAAYRNFQVATDRLNNRATVPADHPARAKANAQLKELDAVLKAQKAGQPGQDLVNYWSQLCALDLP